MARRGSGTLLAGSTLESPHVLLGRILCLSDRLPWPPPSRVSACSACAQVVAAQLDALAASQRALLSWRACRLLGCFCCSAAVLGATMSSRLSPRQGSRLLMTSLLRTACPPLPPQALGVARLPLRLGGLGLRSAAAVARAVYWASWAGSLPFLERQTPSLFRAALPHLSLPEAHAPSRAAAAAVLVLADPSWEPPTWQDVLAGALPAARSDDADSLFLSGDRGWQRHALRPWRTVSSRTCPSTLIPLRWRCWSRSRGCSRAGVLQSRGCALERAAARVCREAGARVTTNTRLADLNRASQDKLEPKN